MLFVRRSYPYKIGEDDPKGAVQSPAAIWYNIVCQGYEGERKGYRSILFPMATPASYRWRTMAHLANLAILASLWSQNQKWGLVTQEVRPWCALAGFLKCLLLCLWWRTKGFLHDFIKLLLLQIPNTLCRSPTHHVQIPDARPLVDARPWTQSHGP